jgi:hypothetical protein
MGTTNKPNVELLCQSINFMVTNFPEVTDRVKVGKALPVTGRAKPYGCETSIFSHFLDSRLTDGGEVVSLTLQRPVTPRKIPGTNFS